ncbi:MAG TPA: hypothetical protein VK393_11820 [Nocardioidaceae bacterium]|jgi:hypothetical protein|nr:hypothetical protein [Nocardioidaceae bacterium]
MHTAWFVEAAEELREIPAPAWLFGLCGFVILLVLLIGTLAYGKGRPHS